MGERFFDICEVGPRDGFQFESKPIPTELKVSVIERMARAGIRRIQATSFVHPVWVPQMADAEEVIERLPLVEGVTFTGLALNERGLRRAIDVGLTHVDLSIATNDTHSRDNANMTVEEASRQADAMIHLADKHGVQAQIGLQTVFGYRAPGDTPMERVLDLCRRFAGMPVESISLADSTGMANPLMLRDRIRAIQDVVGEVPLVLHLHDTRGLGMANVVAAVQEDITRFDTSLGGLGGCPFIPGATGNIATEDTVYLLTSMGFDTGIDLKAVAETSIEVESFLERTMPGRITGLIRKGSEITMPVRTD